MCIVCAETLPTTSVYFAHFVLDASVACFLTPTSYYVATHHIYCSFCCSVWIRTLFSLHLIYMHMYIDIVNAFLSSHTTYCLTCVVYAVTFFSKYPNEHVSSVNHHDQFLAQRIRMIRVDFHLMIMILFKGENLQNQFKKYDSKSYEKKFYSRFNLKEWIYLQPDINRFSFNFR